MIRYRKLNEAANKNVLVKNGQHQRPMVAVLSRYGLGTPDQYCRGIWISESDLYYIKEEMKMDNTRIEQGMRSVCKGRTCTITSSMLILKNCSNRLSYMEGHFYDLLS